MTTYILNSGGVATSADHGKKFFNQIVKDLGSTPKVLLCLFSQPREHWEAKFSEKVQHFLAVMDKNIKPQFELAFPTTFTEQIKQNDAIYLPGGDDHLVQYWLKQFDLPLIWQDKIVATNSGSSHALAKHFWTCDWRQCMDGLGILPIKFLAHYESTDYGKDDPRGPIDWSKAYEELKAYGDQSLPIYTPREGEFEIFEV